MNKKALKYLRRGLRHERSLLPSLSARFTLSATLGSRAILTRARYLRQRHRPPIFPLPIVDVAMSQLPHARRRILCFPTQSQYPGSLASLKRVCDRRDTTRGHPTPWRENPRRYKPEDQENRLAGVIQVGIVCVEIDTGVSSSNIQTEIRQWQSILLPRSPEKEATVLTKSTRTYIILFLQPNHERAESISQQRGKEAESGSGPDSESRSRERQRSCSSLFRRSQSTVAIVLLEISKSVISKRYIMPGPILVQFWSNVSSIVSGIAARRAPTSAEAERSSEPGGGCSWTESAFDWTGWTRLLD